MLFPWVAFRLRAQGFQATKRHLLSPDNRDSQIDSNRAREKALLTARMVRAAARHGFGNPSCLEESLVLLRLLNVQRIAAQLRIGVKKNAPEFEAHAWVECEGLALNETEALHDHYAPFEAELSGTTRS